MTPGVDAMTEGMKANPGYYIAALAISAVVVVFAFFKRSTDARIEDLKAQLAEATAGRQTAQDKVTALLERVIPVVQQMLLATSEAEKKTRRRVGDGVTGSTPGTPNPLVGK